MSKKTPLLLLAIVVLIGIGYGGFTMTKSMGVASRAAEETKAEETERKECQEHLALFYKAWKQYKADNKGAEPTTLAVMIPKYIPDTSVLVCPTAVRLDKQQTRLDRGTIKIDNKDVDVTYGFRWMVSGFARQAKKLGDKIPIVVCKCHQQAMYAVAYGKSAHESSFDDEERAKLSPEVAKAPILGVRRDGTVGELDASSER